MRRTGWKSSAVQTPKRSLASRGRGPRRGRRAAAESSEVALSSAETRVKVCLTESRYVERWLPLVDLPGSVRRGKAAVDAGDESRWTAVADGPMFQYVQALRKDGTERTTPPNPRLLTLYAVELLCVPGRSVVLVEEGLRSRLADVASKAVKSARVSEH